MSNRVDTRKNKKQRIDDSQITGLRIYADYGAIYGERKDHRKCRLADTIKNVMHIQFSSVTQLGPTLCDPIDCSMPGLPVHHPLPEPTQTHVHQVGDAIQPSHRRPLLLSPSTYPSIRVFSRESVLHIRWPKCRSFGFSISPSSEYWVLISFRIVWFDLLAVQETVKSHFQHNSKASILRCSAFFMVQLSHPYMTTEKNHSFD